MKTTKVPEVSCVECGHPFDLATDIATDATPAPGDVSLCIECGNVAMFADDLTLRPISEDEIERMPLDHLSSLQRARKAIMRAIGRDGEWP